MRAVLCIWLIYCCARFLRNFEDSLGDACIVMVSELGYDCPDRFKYEANENIHLDAYFPTKAVESAPCRLRITACRLVLSYDWVH